jgi:hypothetical protein
MRTISDYILIAEVINKHVHRLPDEFIADLTNAFAAESPSFAPDVFLEMCCRVPPQAPDPASPPPSGENVVIFSHGRRVPIIRLGDPLEAG